jgi:hypothetical protein
MGGGVMSNPLQAAFAAADKFIADRLGIDCYFVPGAQSVNNRAVMTIPNSIPSGWVLIKAVVTRGTNPHENATGELGIGADSLAGETPARRYFDVQATYFSAPPTIDDRLIVVATGQNLVIENSQPNAELGDGLITYRFTLRELRNQ